MLDKGDLGEGGISWRDGLCKRYHIRLISLSTLIKSEKSSFSTFRPQRNWKGKGSLHDTPGRPDKAVKTGEYY